MRRFVTEDIRVNFWRPELEYIQFLVDVRFIYDPARATVTLGIDRVLERHGTDGWTDWWFDAAGHTYWAEMHISPAFASQKYLFLHEMGHVLGLEQPADHAAGLDVTLMTWAETVNSRYTVAQVNAVTRYTPGDVLDLQARYGSADGVTELWGDWRDNILFGGQGEVDPVDAHEVMHGGAGNDVLCGNGGADTMAGDEGADVLYGGLGADTFYVSPGDRVMDFNPWEDAIFHV
jgi:hypothetical protein